MQLSSTPGPHYLADGIGRPHLQNGAEKRPTDIEVDAGSSIIRSPECTLVRGTPIFDNLIMGTESIVPADKGYACRGRKQWLKEQAIRRGIIEKGYRGTPLTKRQKQRNKQLSSMRSAVERPYAFVKQILNYQRCRYYNLIRERMQFTLCAIVFNLRRMLSLTACIHTAR